LALRIEDYAVIGNGETIALVGKNGSVDWLSFPRFDSGAFFAALLGTDENGRWIIVPDCEPLQVTRRYREGALVLETTFDTPEGSVVIVDCMNREAANADLLRLVRGLRGSVPMLMEITVRFDYGSVAPWVSRLPDNRLRAVAGSDQLILQTPVELEGRGLKTVSKFAVHAGDEIPFSLRWSHAYETIPRSPEVVHAIEQVTARWRRWSAKSTITGPYQDAVSRSLITLKGLAHHATGGIVAAGTTSLPEDLGGSRNWDYRYCWLRDATFTLYALMSSGFLDEAKAWREWLIRAVAGSPEKMQIMYNVAGERRLNEYEVSWLEGYEGSRPVRIGNAASDQVQLDVYGEVVDMLYQSRRWGLAEIEAGWALERALVEHLETIWDQPDEGIWEVRGGPRQFTHSKVMAWVAFDRAVRSVEEFQVDGPVERWRAARDAVHDAVCEHGYNPELGAFVQSYGSKNLDASLLLLPLVGFLPADDPRIRGTVAQIEKQLLHEGLVMRYVPESSPDGIREPEGVFLACSFWLVDNYILQGERGKATMLYERLLSMRNDVGLLSEEYDLERDRQVGNFPQAFSHVALVNSAHNLAGESGPAHQRSRSRATRHQKHTTKNMAERT
jgi:GH15 family glucan-1,4-alpha-glucosidase